MPRSSQKELCTACWEHPESKTLHRSWLQLLINIEGRISTKKYNWYTFLILIIIGIAMWLFTENPDDIKSISLGRYILSTSDICRTIIITTIISSSRGTPSKRIPIQGGHGWEKVHFSTLFNFRLHTSFTIKICCNRKSPYFEVSTGCGLKFPSESIDDCFSIILT